MDAAVEHLEQHLRETGAHAGAAGRERIGAQQEDRADDVDGQRIADARRMAPDEIALQRAELGDRDADRREIAEAGVHAVDGRLARGELGDELRGVRHPTFGDAIEGHRHPTPRDREDVGDAQVRSGEPQRGHPGYRVSLRFSRYHAESSA